MKICIAGKNEIATECAKWVLSQDLALDVVACFNRSDDGQDTFQPSFRKFCRENRIPEIRLGELQKTKDLVFVSLEFDRIIAPDRFASRALFNIHFSLLPKYKGMYTSAWPILNGEKDTGVTLHQIDNGIDTGDIISQRSFEIDYDDNCRQLYFKYIEHGIGLFKENISDILRGTYSRVPQAPEESTYYSKESIDYGNLVIDLNRTANQIRNQVRAFMFEEYQVPTTCGEEVSSATILESRSMQRPGVILENSKKYIVISSVDYDVRLTKWRIIS